MMQQELAYVLVDITVRAQTLQEFHVHLDITVLKEEIHTQLNAQREPLTFTSARKIVLSVLSEDFAQLKA